MPLDWDDGTLLSYSLNLMFLLLRLGNITSFARDFIAWRPSWQNFLRFIERVLPQNLRINIFD
jgi:hypothetical protein